MKNLFKLKAVLWTAGIIALTAVIGFSMIACEEAGGDTEVTWINLIANGTADIADTTELTLTFDKDPDGLTIDNISVTGATKDTLTTSGTTRTLTISNITVAQGENVTVTITNPDGYAITPDSKTVAINKASANNIDEDVGTGEKQNRKYRVEVYNVSSTTWNYIHDTYNEVRYQDAIKTEVISKGGTKLNTYTSQTFDEVLSKFTSAANEAGYTNIKWGTDTLTAVLKTNNKNGHTLWFHNGSSYRFFYVNRTGTAPNVYTVEVYNINSGTWDYIHNKFNKKTYRDVIRTEVTSRSGSTVLNSYNNQTFDEVLSRFTSAANEAGYTNIKWGTDELTEALQDNNASGKCLWFHNGGTNPNYRFIYVTQEK